MSVSSGLSYDKPLWEIHLLLAHNCLVFRIHHALGDGVSLMSMLLACCRRIDGEEALPRIPSFENKKSNSNSSGGCSGSWWKLYLYYLSVLWGFVKMGFFSLVFVVEFVLRALWVRDRETVISGGEGVELWPRKLATARFLIQDMKVVKKAVPNAVRFCFNLKKKKRKMKIYVLTCLPLYHFLFFLFIKFPFSIIISKMVCCFVCVYFSQKKIKVKCAVFYFERLK